MLEPTVFVIRWVWGAVIGSKVITFYWARLLCWPPAGMDDFPDI